MGTINIGVLIVSVFVSVVAIVGLIYFNIQDKKEAKKSKDNCTQTK